MLALDSATSGNQKVQALRAVTFNSIGKGTPKVTLLKGLSSFSTFLYSTSFGAQHFLVFLFQCGNPSWNTRVFSLASVRECPVLGAFHVVVRSESLLTDSQRCLEEGSGREGVPPFFGPEYWMHF